MPEIVIVLNEKDKGKYQGEGNAKDSKGKEGRGKEEKNTPFFLRSD